MFGNAYFYHGLIRKYVIMFGNMFNDIMVQRTDSVGNRIQTIPVPIAYGPKETWLARINADPDLDRQVSVQLPRIGFEIISINPDFERQLSSTKRHHKASTTDNNSLKTQFTPVPYEINMDLSIFVRNADEGMQIIEQILPFFKPEWTQTLKLIPEMDIKKDIPTIIQGVALEDSYEGDFINRRALIWTLTFVIKAYLFGPISNKGIIKRAQIDFQTVPGGARQSRVEVTPGLTVDDLPTTNPDLSVSIDDINIEDDFGFAVDIQTFFDGFTFNPSTGKDEP